MPPIKNINDNQHALERLVLIFDSKKGTAEGDQLETLGILPLLVFSFCPNSSNRKFQYLVDDLHMAENTVLEIYNLHGNKIYQSVITNSKHEIDLSSQSAGIYFVEIYEKKTIFKKKL